MVNERETWVSTLDFLLALIGCSVGLGNVWRFPYLCYKNGGGCFLIPYLLCVVFAGVPLLVLETAMGQWMSQGCITAWKICPILQGIGISGLVVNLYMIIYYIIILAWTFFYLFHSFTTTLPWSHCNNDWNTASCFIGEKIVAYNVSINGTLNYTTKYLHFLHTTTPTNEFWERKVLNMSNGLGEFGSINWQLALCLLLAWIVCYFCVWKGVKSSGRVVYFTATVPYVLLTILLVRAVTLPGAVVGIKYYLLPDLSKLKEGKVWIDAATQVFFSYTIGLGVMVALGSYNKFKHNCYRDCIIFAIVNSGTSIYSGFIIFAVLGFLANKQGIDVQDITQSGPGLAFIGYPAAIAEMPVAPLWSVLFFFVLILLGIDSQFVGLEGFITAIVDLFPKYIRHGRRKEVFIAVMCVIWFFIGLTMVTEGGIYVFQLFDNYAVSGSAILWVCTFESIAIGWIYGAERFYQNIEQMIGFRLNPFLKICWLAMTPLFCAGVFIFLIATYQPLVYNTYHYPDWGEAIGWCLALSSMVWIPIFAVYKLITTKGDLRTRIKLLSTPVLHPDREIKEDGKPSENIQLNEKDGLI
ncbi:sodium- and chloride-dependent taurine transporter isoform X1 [Exaiptasia diaphana]|uniref:Transporter n=1 Tax=Exaiptasia diaphana TaxID=2652724 RepID=A0A913Y351_EXADI|nr:sodium- and chloride-dependent taurine transporter isoform X1 [Exaiptasia diaphana]XP_020913373.1 sodium- and chloride-dependent taurine transporter isoform X1 [Exaiptasia diaphana]